MVEFKRARRAGAAAVTAAAAVSGTALLLLASPPATGCPALTGTVGSVAVHGGCGPLDCPPVDCAPTNPTRGGGNHATMGTSDRGSAPFEIAAVDFTFLPNAPVIKPNTVTPTQSAGCRIKGNISSKGERIYHVPGGKWYDKTGIDVSKGERWFCTEAEASAAGWRPAKQ